MKNLLKSLRPLPLALLAAAALAAPLAQAQAQARAEPAGAAHARHGEMRDGMWQAIGASADQQAKIKAIMKQAHDDVRQQRQSGQDLKRQLAQVLAAPNVDAAAAESLRQKLLAQHDLSGQRMLQARLQVAAVLTPEQRQKLLALKEERRGKWHGSHEG